MKKIISLIALLCFTAVVSQAANTVISITSGAMSNVPTLLSASCQVKNIILQPAAGNAGSCMFYDTSYPSNGYTNAAYIGVSRYATNYVTTWTNYYGVVNSTTNVALYTLTNTVAQVTSTFPPLLSLATATNTSTEFQNMNTTFVRGIGVTNTSSGTITLTITYVQ